MSSYKATLSKSDLYQMLSAYENRIQKKVQQIASKVINMSNIQPYNKEDNYKTNMTNPEKEKSIRSNSTFDAFNKPTGMFLSKNKIVTNIENKLGESHHLPRIKIDKNKSVVKQKTNKSIIKPKYAKPKFVPRKPVILSKQIRNNPFSDPRPIPVSQLKQGLFNLMNKGIINKDVDISVAFEWGQAPFKSKGAVIHSYDEVVIHEQQLQKPEIKQRKDDQVHNFSNSIKNPSPSIAEKDGWAITGLDSPIIAFKKNQQAIKQRQSLNMQIIHIQFKNFSIKTENKQFRQFKKRNIQNWGQILQFFKEVQSYVKKYNISLVFVDGRKVILYSLCLTKLSENDIKDCIVGSSSEKHKYQSLKRIPNGVSKQKIAIQMITKLLQANVMRKRYQKTQFIKASKQRIANWITSIIERRKTRIRIRQNIQIRNTRISHIQKQFQQNYSSIVAEKHFEIHVPSHHHTGSFDFPENLNTEVTRIFNLKPNINIIYVSPIQMSEETINYYYKIMQLGQVQNFKERVKFINCQKNMYFDNETLSKRVYYSSTTIRQIKKLIFGSKAVLVNGECQEAHWYLVDSLKIPSITNFRKYELMKRSSSLSIFRTLDVPYLPFSKIDPLPINDFNFNQLTRKLSNFVTDNKLKNMAIKLNSEAQSIATIKCPFRNYDDLVEKTKIHHSYIFSSPNLFFKQLLKVGGVAEKLQQFRYLSSLIYVSPIKTISVFGTFERIKTVDYTTIGACFPQQVVKNQDIVSVLQTLGDGLIKDIGFYGYAQVNFVVDRTSVMLQGIDWGLNQIGSSLFYFQYLASAKQTEKGLYESQVLQSQNSVILTQYRYFVYCPYVLHFGLNQSQLRNFFQLCRSQGISFDLEKKYGSAFTLLQGVKNALGILATGKSIQVALGLIVQAINFIYRQTYKNNSEDRELRIRDRNNILSIKSRLQQYYNRGVYD